MMDNISHIVEEIKSQVEVSGSYIGVILGAGSAEFLDEVKNRIELPLRKVKSFKLLGSDVDLKLIFGEVGEKKVIILLGRRHYNFGYEMADIGTPIFVLKELGCEKLIMCSSVGSINHKVKVGDVVTFEDHVNMTGRNPLYKCDWTKYGHMFIDMTEPYDSQMIDTLVYVAKKQMSIKVKKCTYIEFPGPSIETVAESRLADIIGADVVGFNMCNEVIAAKYCNLPVIVYSLVTNYSTAFTNNKIKHEDVVYNRQCASSYYLELLARLIAEV